MAHETGISGYCAHDHHGMFSAILQTSGFGVVLSVVDLCSLELSAMPGSKVA